LPFELAKLDSTLLSNLLGPKAQPFA